jgi:hypothetical protein
MGLSVILLSKALLEAELAASYNVRPDVVFYYCIKPLLLTLEHSKALQSGLAVLILLGGIAASDAISSVSLRNHRHLLASALPLSVLCSATL